MSIKQSDLAELAQKGFTHVPLMREVLADLDTPVSTYLKLAGGPYSYLFESVEGGAQWGRYSIIGLPCRTVMRISGNEVVVESSGVVTERETWEEPLEAVRQFQQRYRVPDIDGMPRFTGGIVGYFGYDTIRHIETHLGPCHKPDPLQVPDILLMMSDEVLVFDNLSGRLYLIVHVDLNDMEAWESGQSRLDELVDQLRQARIPATADGEMKDIAESDFRSGFAQAEFEDAVGRSRQYIRNGGIERRRYLHIVR